MEQCTTVTENNFADRSQQRATLWRSNELPDLLCNMMSFLQRNKASAWPSTHVQQEAQPAIPMGENEAMHTSAVGGRECKSIAEGTDKHPAVI